MKNEEEARRKRKDYNLRRRYGITLEIFEAILESQGGICPICEKSNVTFCVDHNHKTLKIRGIICLSCNLRVIGGARDQDYKIVNAAVYVTRNPADELFPDGIYLEKNPPKTRRKKRATSNRRKR
jgi:DNA-directed RNA polymerase subunit RPC12/RpoP